MQEAISTSLAPSYEKTRPGDDWYLSDDIAPVYAQHLEFCMEVGLVTRTRAVVNALSNPRFVGRSEIETALEMAAAWLPAAEAYEARHGLWSKLDREHPKFASLVFQS